MAITSTTLASACGATDTAVLLADSSHAFAPTFVQAGTDTLLKVDAEMMYVIGSPNSAGWTPVVRGVNGTAAVAHLVSTPVLVGYNFTDFQNFKPSVSAFEALGELSVGEPFADKAAPAPKNGALHHITGTTTITSIVPQDTSKCQEVWFLFDGTGNGLKFTGGSSANNPAVSGTVSRYQAVQFIYDPTTTLWYPGTIT